MTSAYDGSTRFRVAVVAAGDPTDETTWSGTPSGLMDGFAALGHDVVPIDAMPRSASRRAATAAIAARRAVAGPHMPLRHALWAARYGAEWGAVLSRTAGRQLHRVKADYVVQAGEGWAVHHPNVAMYLDMTTHQAIAHRMFAPPSDLSMLDDARERAATDAFLRIRAVCTSTPWAARSVIQDHGIPPARVHAVGIGSRPLEHTAVTRDFSTPRFLFVGSRWERKNGPVVLAAFRRLRHEFSNATLDIVGEHPPIDEPGVSAHGVLARDDAAHQKKLAELYSRATCLVVPGSFEAAGIVFTEAGQHGIPSICGDVGGAPDIVGAGGVSVTPGDVDELRAAMRAVTGPDGERMGEIAARRAELFTWPAVAERILSALRSQEIDEKGELWGRRSG